MKINKKLYVKNRERIGVPGCRIIMPLKKKSG
jgi:hypothetical protein